MAFMNQTEN